MVVVGIIPAAGYATRLQPLPCSKEVYRIGGKPVMDYLVDRMRSAGCSELRVVTRPEKADVIGHAIQHGATVIKAYPASVTHSILDGMQGLADDDIVLIGFPDTIWEPPDGYSRLVRAVTDGYEVALGLFRAAEPERSDVVSFRDSGLITRVDVKPRAPTSNWIWGCGAARARALWAMEGDREPGAYLDSLCRKVEVLGIWLSDVFIDIGTKRGLSQALAYDRRLEA